MGTIVVSGAIANKYRNGGAAWVRLSWVLGLRQLGFQVYFVEQIAREHCLHPEGQEARFETSLNLAYFEQVVEQFGLAGHAALIYEDGAEIAGLTRPELLEVADAADLLVNITGHLAWRPLVRCFRRKAYVDLDPGFTQFWHAAGHSGARLEGHDFYFTVGENIGTADCPIPMGEIPWRPLRPPVVLEYWPVSSGAVRDRFTTVASWRGPYGPVDYQGTTYGLKVHEFRRFVELPRRAPGRFEIALEIHPADYQDLQLLQTHGWHIVDPEIIAPDPMAFRSYVQGSSAECSVAQSIYVQSQCGWFSDRTVRYLASGKPALVQDTGFTRNYPADEGLMAFRTMDQAVAGAESILRDYERHCRAARALAETYFDSDRVLSQMIDQVGVCP